MKKVNLFGRKMRLLIKPIRNSKNKIYKIKNRNRLEKWNKLSKKSPRLRQSKSSLFSKLKRQLKELETLSNTWKNRLYRYLKE